jgi:hypothetical protein
MEAEPLDLHKVDSHVDRATDGDAIAQLAGEQVEYLRQLALPGEREILELELREMLLEHLADLGLSADVPTTGQDNLSKDVIRKAHRIQRREAAEREAILIETHGRPLLHHFGEGEEIDVGAISPELILVAADTEESRLFRMATLLWSVPVSRGYGRRLRFLVRDRSNEKLIGIFALGSPVFNLGPRDDWIGWDHEVRSTRLINVMDAFVVGAVPPYSQLIGGKLVAALMGSSEVGRYFDQQYGGRRGIITESVQTAQLALITTTSALGRSSLYNRLRLPGLIEFHRIGVTGGWGHFHMSEPIFKRMRRLLQVTGHKYANGHQYGDGPNWRMRVVRASLEMIGIEWDVLRHGIQREVYAAPLAENWQDYLLGNDSKALISRPPAQRIADACIERWIAPRAERRPEFQNWTRGDTWKLLTGEVAEAVPTGWEP